MLTTGHSTPSNDDDRVLSWTVQAFFIMSLSFSTLDHHIAKLVNWSANTPFLSLKVNTPPKLGALAWNGGLLAKPTNLLRICIQLFGPLFLLARKNGTTNSLTFE